MMNLEDRLRRELERASAALPVVGIDLDTTLVRGRRARRRTMILSVAAAAVVIALAIGGTAGLIRSVAGGPRPQPPAGNGLKTPTPEDTASRGAPRLDRVEPVLRDWLGAIRDGDEGRAWALMTPAAQAAVGRDRFDDMMASELPEGLGAFVDAPGFDYVVVSMDGDAARVAATLSGRVAREGTTEFGAIAIRMQVRGVEALVDDPIFDRTRYFDRTAVFASVSAGPLSFHAGDELTVEFARPAGATDVLIAVDDDRRSLPTEFDPSSGTATATLDRDLEAGRHIATVVVLHRSGSFYPEATVFEAVEP